MNYPEFVKATGCNDNRYNWDIYNAMEDLCFFVVNEYVVYEYAKRLINNDPSANSHRFIFEVSEFIKFEKFYIEFCEEKIAKLEDDLKKDPEDELAVQLIDSYKDTINDCQETIKETIRRYKYIL